MDTGIVISYIIGGLLLLAILFMNMNVGQSSNELTMRQMTQQHVKTVSEILSHDFQKIGYDRFEKIPNAITIAESNRIRFESNIDNSGSTEVVEWFYDSSTSLSSSTNPDAHPLQRTISGDVTNMNVGVTSFEITYMDKDFNELATPVPSGQLNDIRHIKVEMVISSKEAMGTRNGGSKYIRSPLEKTFTPKNLGN